MPVLVSYTPLPLHLLLATYHPPLYHLFFIIIPRPPRPTLFPYTTLFRSCSTRPGDSPPDTPGRRRGTRTDAARGISRSTGCRRGSRTRSRRASWRGFAAAAPG